MALASSTSVSSSIAVVSSWSWGLSEELEEIDIESVNSGVRLPSIHMVIVLTGSAALQRVTWNCGGKGWMKPFMNSVLRDTRSGNFEDLSAYIHWDARKKWTHRGRGSWP